MALETQLHDATNDAETHALRGLSLAFLHRPTDAVHEAQRAVALAPVDKFLLLGVYNLKTLAWVYTLTGQQDKAIDTLEEWLRMPSYLSPALLRIDPTWAPLRGNPRFQRLIG